MNELKKLRKDIEETETVRRVESKLKYKRKFQFFFHRVSADDDKKKIANNE